MDIACLPGQSRTSGRAGADLTIELDRHAATVEIRRPPNNFFDFDLIRKLADA